VNETLPTSSRWSFSFALAFVIDVDGVGRVELSLCVVVHIDVHAIGDRARADHREVETERGGERIQTAVREDAGELSIVALLVS
jgi:hypothetical protein